MITKEKPVVKYIPQPIYAKSLEKDPMGKIKGRKLADPKYLTGPENM